MPLEMLHSAFFLLGECGREAGASRHRAPAPGAAPPSAEVQGSADAGLSGSTLSYLSHQQGQPVS